MFDTNARTQVKSSCGHKIAIYQNVCEDPEDDYSTVNDDKACNFSPGSVFHDRDSVPKNDVSQAPSKRRICISE